MRIFEPVKGVSLGTDDLVLFLGVTLIMALESDVNSLFLRDLYNLPIPAQDFGFFKSVWLNLVICNKQSSVICALRLASDDERLK